MLDTWAMIAYLRGEPAAQPVRQVLRRAKGRRAVVLFSLINYGECLYLTERRDGLPGVQAVIRVIDQSAVVVVPAERSLVFEAAHMKARYPISYADAFAAALSKRHGARLITGDTEFRALEREISIHWLPARRG